MKKIIITIAILALTGCSSFEKKAHKKIKKAINKFNVITIESYEDNLEVWKTDEDKYINYSYLDDDGKKVEGVVTIEKFSIWLAKTLKE